MPQRVCEDVHQGKTSSYEGHVLTNRFKGLDLIARVPQEQWKEISNIVQEAGIKPSQIKRNLQEGKMVV